MALIKRNFPALTNLSDFFDDDWFDVRLADRNWSPAVNVIDNKKNYEIEVAAPGLKRDDFTINIENGILTISGITEKEKEQKEKNYTRKEFSYKSFSKSFTLPENVNEEAVKAKYHDGVLKLILNKTDKEVLPSKKEVIIE